VTVRNLEVVEIDLEDNLLLVKGAVPGPNGGYVIVRRAKR
jgi:large subunit ribosomal protein L3